MSAAATSRTQGRTTLALALLLASTGCEREQRVFRGVPPGASPLPAVQVSQLRAGPVTADPDVTWYQENRWAVGQGQRWYVQFNCAGCHSPGGGGGMGPPFTDAEWIYGSEPENIVATIVEGRPNGMPSFRGRLESGQLWQLAAYVRSLSGLTPMDTWAGRSDNMQETVPPREPPRPTTSR